VGDHVGILGVVLLEFRTFPLALRSKWNGASSSGLCLHSWEGIFLAAADNQHLPMLFRYTHRSVLFVPFFFSYVARTTPTSFSSSPARAGFWRSNPIRVRPSGSTRSEKAQRREDPSAEQNCFFIEEYKATGGQMEDTERSGQEPKAMTSPYKIRTTHPRQVRGKSNHVSLQQSARKKGTSAKDPRALL
jgi:hypothetical protein